MLVGRKLIVANLGDSEAVMGRRKQPAPAGSAKETAEGWEAVLLSEKHTPSMPAEADRYPINQREIHHVVFLFFLFSASDLDLHL